MKHAQHDGPQENKETMTTSVSNPPPLPRLRVFYALRNIVSTPPQTDLAMNLFRHLTVLPFTQPNQVLPTSQDATTFQAGTSTE